MTFIDSKGSHSYPFRKTWASGFGIWFKNRRCELCNDPFSKNADMAVGDAYFLQESDTNGTTFCITRNNRLNEILKKMEQEQIIVFENGPSKEIQEKFYKVLFLRENDFLKKIAKLKKTLAPVPDVSSPLPKVSLMSALKYRYAISKHSLGKYHFLWKFLWKKHSILKDHLNERT